MSAVKTLAASVAAWIVLGMASAQADPISPWTTFGVSSYQATSAGSPTPSGPLIAASPMAPVSVGAMTMPTIVPAASSPSPSDTNPAPAASSGPVDAFLNMTAGGFADSGTLLSGNPQPWYDSPTAAKAFGGVPDAQQQASFVQSVLNDVRQTFQLTGMNPTLTTDPTAPALHTISVVSGATYADNPGAIGITNVGGNGFSLIDNLDYANNPTDLAWAVAHNISHELMHAFGIGFHPDGGSAVDAATANWSDLISPTMQFGPSATQLLLASQYGTLGGSAGGLGAQLMLNPDGTKRDGDMELLAVPAPEPAAMAMWAFGALGGLPAIRRRASRPSA